MAMIKPRKYWRLDGQRLSLLFAATTDGHILLRYCGTKLPDSEAVDHIVTSTEYGSHESQADMAPSGGLLTESKYGYEGSAGVDLRSDNHRLYTDFRFVDAEASQNRMAFIWKDAKEKLVFKCEWALSANDIVTARTKLTNTGDRAVGVDWMASLLLPLPPAFDQLTSYTGRWAKEMREQTVPITNHRIERVSGGGRPGFSGANWARLSSSSRDGLLGAHLGWSGDHRMIVERNNDGQAMLLMGARLDPGEIVLKPGGTFAAPDAFFGWAGGRADRDDLLSHAFHKELRAHILPDRSTWPARKVHINSWEALSFDLEERKLMALADRAADLGVERFVLDDGWFQGRRGDRSSLGDWTVDTALFPDDLEALIAHIHNLNMDFGLWVEPEMVSPDSDLYRAHPDWCLHVDGIERRTQRGQLVLDLTRKEVSDYLFTALNTLLSNNAIAYLKWDHNRELFPAANVDGPVGHAQTKALYALLDRLRAAHPMLEIETCASGGGRIDYEILRRCNRVWASDNNDAIERLRLNDSWSRYLPLEIIGNHVGPSPNPITGRRLDMDFRAKVAMFGHMGVEADPAKMSGEERDLLAAHIAHYKEWRGLLHSGALHHLAHPSPTIFGQVVVSEEKALALVAQTAFADDYNVPPVRLPGLEAEQFYRVTLLRPWPVKAARYLTNPKIWEAGLMLSGTALAESGLALPLAHPETAWLIVLEKAAG